MSETGPETTRSARDLIRPCWMDLVERLDASLLIHHLYGSGILAWKELEDMVQLTNRRDQVVALLMAMSRRSADECYQFSVLLSETEGIKDVGLCLLKICASERRAYEGRHTSQDFCPKGSEAQPRQEVATLPTLATVNGSCSVINAGTSFRRKHEIVYSPWKSWNDIPRQSCWPWNCVVQVPPNRLFVGDRADLLSLDLYTNKWKPYHLGNVNIHSVFRCGSGIDPYVLLLDKSKNKFAVEQYNIAKGFRQHVSYLPPWYQSQLQLGHHMTVAADNNRIFIVSGRTSTYEALDCVWLYHLLVDQWQRISDMSIKRCACSPFVLDGALYVGGGIVKTSRDNWIGCELVEYFSERENCWRSAALTKNTRSRLMPCNGKVVSVGGTVDKEAGDLITSEIELINLQTNASSYIPSMSYGRRGHGICVDDADTLFVVGGYNKEGFLTSVESYSLH